MGSETRPLIPAEDQAPVVLAVGASGAFAMAKCLPSARLPLLADGLRVALCGPCCPHGAGLRPCAMIAR